MVLPVERGQFFCEMCGKPIEKEDIAGRCIVCGKVLCRQCGVLCATCGKILCRVHGKEDKGAFYCEEHKPGCFIATAAYGSELAPPVQFLREFRDNVVLESRYSKFFEKILDVYYIFSPSIAKAMMEHNALKLLIKYVIVWPFVKIAQACARARISFKRRCYPLNADHHQLKREKNERAQ